MRSVAISSLRTKNSPNTAESKPYRLIFAVESVPKRQELARHFGADIVVDFRENDPVQSILEMTNGEGGGFRN
jgi:threonine dehydrogenase-like Zn-dependent dehydrogenase